MEEKDKTFTFLDHPRLRKEFYLHCGPQHSFWELFNGWTMLMDFICAGISWEHKARIDIDEQDGKCTPIEKVDEYMLRSNGSQSL